MWERIRGLLSSSEDDDRTGIFAVDLPDGPPDERALVEAFERSLDAEGVTVDGDRADVVETFADAVAGYGELVPALRALGERVGDDGVADSIGHDHDEIARWREDHPEAVETIDSTTEALSDALERVETTDAVSDDDVPEALDEFARRVRSLPLLTED